MEEWRSPPLRTLTSLCRSFLHKKLFLPQHLSTLRFVYLAVIWIGSNYLESTCCQYIYFAFKLVNWFFSVSSAPHFLPVLLLSPSISHKYGVPNFYILIVLISCPRKSVGSKKTSTQQLSCCFMVFSTGCVSVKSKKNPCSTEGNI